MTSRAALAALLLAVLPVAAGPPWPAPVRFTASASGRTEAALDIVVERWSTETDLDFLGRILATEGKEAFREAVRRRGPAGYVHEFVRRPEVRREWQPLDAAFDLPAGTGGRRVVLLRARDDGTFLVIELVVPPSGDGRGRAGDYAAVGYNPVSKNVQLWGAYGEWRLAAVRVAPALPK